MSVTVQQFRAARGFLGWSQTELATKARVSRSVIAGFELGVSTPQPRVMEDLVEAFEAEGIVFLTPREGEHGLGVAWKWGKDLAQTHPQPRSKPQETGGTRAWDGFQGDGDGLGDLKLASWWVTQSELWNRLSSEGRKALNGAMFGHPDAGEELFQRDTSISDAGFEPKN